MLLYPEDIEKDDDLHNPDNVDARDCDIFTKRGFFNVGGLVMITIGLLVLFIGYPALYVLLPCFMGVLTSVAPLSEHSPPSLILAKTTRIV